MILKVNDIRHIKVISNIPRILETTDTPILPTIPCSVQNDTDLGDFGVVHTVLADSVSASQDAVVFIISSVVGDFFTNHLHLWNFNCLIIDLYFQISH
jgi:hypothetical protein